MDKSVEQIRSDAVATLNAAIEEARTARLTQFVIAETDSALPFRVSGDGTIRLLGDTIFHTPIRRHAMSLVTALNAKYDEKGLSGGVAVYAAAAWRTKRIAKLQEMIVQIQG